MVARARWLVIGPRASRVGTPAQRHRLRRSHPLPGRDALADQGMDRLAEGGHGLVDRHIEHAGRPLGQQRSRLRDGHVVPLWPGAAHPQAVDLIRAQTREAPHNGQGADHLDWIGRRAAVPVSRDIVSRQMHGGHDDLGPQRGLDHPRIGADLTADGARRGEAPRRGKAARNPLPLLTIAEEGAHAAQVVVLGARPDRRARDVPFPARVDRPLTDP